MCLICYQSRGHQPTPTKAKNLHMQLASLDSHILSILFILPFCCSDFLLLVAHFSHSSYSTLLNIIANYMPPTPRFWIQMSRL